MCPLMGIATRLARRGETQETVTTIGASVYPKNTISESWKRACMFSIPNLRKSQAKEATPYDSASTGTGHGKATETHRIPFFFPFRSPSTGIWAGDMVPLHGHRPASAVAGVSSSCTATRQP